MGTVLKGEPETAGVGTGHWGQNGLTRLQVKNTGGKMREEGGSWLLKQGATLRLRSLKINSRLCLDSLGDLAK